MQERVEKTGSAQVNAWAVFLETPISYGPCVALQERLVEARLHEKIPDTVLFLEHRPVVTLGRRGRDNYLRLSRSAYEERGIELFRSTRGGDVTYHGPGQLIVYPVLRLGTHEADAHGYLYNLEEVAIRTASAFGVEAYRREGMNGAWTNAGKIAAIGFRLKRWITCHGMSFNVDLDLAGFDTIVGCGLEGERVSSLKEILGTDCPTLHEVRVVAARNFQNVFERTFEVYQSKALPSALKKLFADVGRTDA